MFFNSCHQMYRNKLLREVAGMETTPLAQVRLVADTLGSRMVVKTSLPESYLVVLKVAADLLNWFGKDEGKELLKSIEKEIPS